MISDLKKEQMIPYVAAVVAAGIIWLVNHLGFQTPQGDEMLGAMVSLGGIFAGFLATLKTLLAAMNEETYQRLKDSGYLNDLIRYLREAIAGAILLCIFAMLGFDDTISFELPYSMILFGLLFFSVAALYRVTTVGLNLLANR